MSHNNHAARLVAGLLAATVAVSLLPSPAAAQLILDPSVQRGKDKNRPDAIVRTAPGRANPNALNIWPRLDVGAVFCKTQGDLAMHSRVVAARLDGAPQPTTVRPECVTISTPTPIDIVERVSAGQTEVRIKDQGPRVGWTDAYLPDKQ